MCNADLARPGVIAGVGGSLSGVFTAHSPMTSGGSEAISITARGLTPNGHGDMYAVWLEPAARTSSGGYVLVKPIVPRLLGVIKPPVDPDGRLAAEGLAPPSDVNAWYLLLIALQRGGSVKAPGRTVLEGFIVL